MPRLKLEKTKISDVYVVWLGGKEALFRLTRVNKTVAISAEETNPNKDVEKALCSKSDAQLYALLEKAK